jgi:TonB family protein
MNSLKLNIMAVFAGLILLTTAATAQDLSFNYEFQFEPTFLTQGPKIKDFHVNYPEEARKNGIDGTVKVTFVLGKDGKTRDAAITQDLPFGVGDELIRAVTKIIFTPAMNNEQPIDLKATLTYKIAAIYQEYDDNITKAKLLGKPTAEYPSAFRADGTKGKVAVAVIFYTDGKLKVLNTDSTMPPEFDAAAKKGAENLKFQPAVHKKSKKPVAQSMWVIFEFKP